MKTVLLSIAWVAFCASFVGLFIGIELDLNFFSWDGVWHLQSVVCITGVVVLSVATYFLAIATEQTSASIVAAVSCLLLIGIALYVVAPEPLGNPGQWLSRSTASPEWYRWGRLTITCIPLAILAGMSIRRERSEPRDRYDETHGTTKVEQIADGKTPESPQPPH